MKRLHIEIQGVVQGVGFRPYCFQLAERYELSGWVLNHGGGVSLEIQGDSCDEYCDALQNELPPLAHIDALQLKEIPTQDEVRFEIRKSTQSAVTSTIPADSNVCSECIKELFDPNSRYYHYPFLNCTHCGPRYTLTNHLPYDRPQTSMARFDMCDACLEEYKNPHNRRFHAQPTACPNCGPQLDASPADIVTRIQAGEILAIKGLGGFHLVCDARNNEAVTTLRQRKNREEKPLAIMAANIKSLKNFVEVDEQTEQLLCSPQRPIVLAPKRDNPKQQLSKDLAPGLKWLGVMLPYTPLHYLLFNQACGIPNGTQWLEEINDLVLVMTSANPGGEPLVTANKEAHQRLEGIADSIVCHNRDIVTRADDSVMRIIDGSPSFIRRARSFVPRAIKLAHDLPATLAVGGYLKNTVCVTRGNEAFVSQHIGDMNNSATIRFFEETVHHLLDTLEVKPQCIAHDLHPDFYSTRFAQGLAEELGITAFGVQHHHAHLAAVAAEQQLEHPAIGVALDGFGLGENNQAWGGELMRLHNHHYQHIGSLAPLQQPGGDKAAREPWRMAAAVYQMLGRGDEIPTLYPTQAAAKQLSLMMNKGINSPQSSSAGRLFDAAAGILDIQQVSSFEGQAPMQLEGMVTQTKVLDSGWQIEEGILSLKPLLKKLTEVDAQEGANLFHGTLVAALSDWVTQAAKHHSVETVLLGGGCFLNHVLSQGLLEKLKAQGLKPKIAQQAPVNDGGISLGQAWIAGLKQSALE